MKDFLHTVDPKNWFRENPLLERTGKQNILDSDNGLSFSGDIDPTIPDDHLLNVPETAASTALIKESVETSEEKQRAEAPTEQMLTSTQPSEVPPSQQLPEIVINDMTRKQLVSADEELKKHWQSFQDATRNQRQLMEAFEQAQMNQCWSINDQPSVLGAVYMVKRKDCADTLIDRLEDVELDLKKLLDRERRLLKDIHVSQLPDWVKEIQTHRREIESHLMTGMATTIFSRVGLSEEE